MTLLKSIFAAARCCTSRLGNACSFQQLRQLTSQQVYRRYYKKHPKRIARYYLINFRIGVLRYTGPGRPAGGVFPPARNEIVYRGIYNRALIKQRRDPDFVPRRLCLVGRDDVLVPRLSARGFGEGRMSEIGGIQAIEDRFYEEIDRRERAAAEGRRGTNALLNRFLMVYKKRVLKGREPEMLDENVPL